MVDIIGLQYLNLTENPHLQMKNNLLEFPHRKAFGFDPGPFKSYTEDHKYKEERDLERLGLGPPQQGKICMVLPEPTAELHHTNDQKLIFFCTPIGGHYVDEEVTIDMSVVEARDTLKYWAYISECLQAWTKQFGVAQTKGWRIANHAKPLTTARPHAHVWSM